MADEQSLTGRGPQTRGLFDRLAGHYDRFNHVTSLGVDGWWRRRSLRGIQRGSRLLDLGCGGGQMSRRLARKFPVRVGLDPSVSMLKSGTPSGPGYFPVQGSGESLPFRDGVFDHVISGFVMRNLADLPRTLSETRRILSPGGVLTVLEFFPPKSRLLQTAFSIYLGKIVPGIYHWLTARGRDARWLHDSISGFVGVEEFRRMLQDAGFDRVECRRLIFGLAWCLRAEPHPGSDGASR